MGNKHTDSKAQHPSSFVLDTKPEDDKKVQNILNSLPHLDSLEEDPNDDGTFRFHVRFNSVAHMKHAIISNEYVKLNHYLPFKLICVGDGGSNKTAFLIKLVHNSDMSEYVPTVFDNYSIDYVYHGLRYRLNLFDTAGQEEYDRLRALSYPQTDLVLFVFQKN